MDYDLATGAAKPKAQAASIHSLPNEILHQILDECLADSYKTFAVPVSVEKIRYANGFIDLHQTFPSLGDWTHHNRALDLSYTCRFFQGYVLEKLRKQTWELSQQYYAVLNEGHNQVYLCHSGMCTAQCRDMPAYRKRNQKRDQGNGFACTDCDACQTANAKTRLALELWRKLHKTVVTLLELEA